MTPQGPVQPAAHPLLRWFSSTHLPADLQVVVMPFGALAVDLARGPAGSERTTAIRKLLEAKDAAVRAAIEAREVKPA